MIRRGCSRCVKKVEKTTVSAVVFDPGLSNAEQFRRARNSQGCEGCRRNKVRRKRKDCCD